MPGGGEDHVARGEAAGVKVENDLLVEAGDGLHRSEDRAAKRMALPEVLGEGLVDEVVGVVLVHLDLFEDDSLIAGDVFGGEGGVESRKGPRSKCWCNILIQNLDIEADALFAGESVEVAADGVDLSRELVGRARRGALEDHVFDEMGYAIEGEGLVARAGIDPDAHGDGTDVGNALGEDQQAIGQTSAADVAGGGCGGLGGEGCGHATP